MKEALDELSTAQMLAEIASHYSLGPITSIAPIRHPGSTIYRVESKQNKGFLLKRHRLSKGLNELLHEEKVLSALNAQGFERAPLLVSTTGHHFHFCFKSHYWSLFEFVDSDASFDWTQPSWSLAQCLSAGRTLASLHIAALNSLKESKRHPDYLQALPDGMDDVLRQAATQLVSFEGDRALLQEVAQQVPALKRSLEVCLLEAQRISSSLPSIVIHGDYHPGNLLFRKSEVACVVDFEYVQKRQAAYDLGYAAVFFASVWQPPQQEGNIDRRYIDNFMSGYCLMIGELAATLPVAPVCLLPFMRLACHLLITWSLDNALNASNTSTSYFMKALRHGLRTLAILENSTESYTYAVPLIGDPAE